MKNANAEILLFQKDGSVVLQIRDDKPGITNPGLISSFGGHIEKGEEPIDAALREINEETNLNLKKDQLRFYHRYKKSKAVHGEDWDVYYFGVGHVDISELKVFEGTGYTVIHDINELKVAKTSKLLQEVLTDYFEGFRKYLFMPDIDEDSRVALFNDILKNILKDHKPSKYKRPVALACTGLVASGKSTITTPLAEMSDCVTVSSDKIREEFFRRGFNFNKFRPLMVELLEFLSNHRYNIFLDFNITTNTHVLDELKKQGYYIFITHANPPYDFIKHKILSGNMKHELTFFTKDEHVYLSMLTWKDEHLKKLPKLKQDYGIWYEVDTSSKELEKIIENMKSKFQQDLKKLE